MLLTLFFGLLSVAGVLVCRAIVLHALRRDTALTRIFCPVTDRKDAVLRFDCDKVLSSPAASLTKKIGWADIGVVYFVAVAAFLLLTVIVGWYREALLLLAPPAVLAVLGSLASLYYQARVIHSWCKLCLLATAVVWCQAGILGFFVTGAAPLMHSLHWLQTAALGCCCLGAASLWLRVKPLAVLAGTALESRRQLRSWKHNPRLFTTLLRSSARADTSRWENELVLGEPNASLQLTVAMSLQCAACRRDYQHLRQLHSRFGAGVAVVIRFRPYRGLSDLSLPSVLDYYFAAADEAGRLAVLDAWFGTMNLSRFRQQMGGRIASGDHRSLVKNYLAWFDSHSIRQIPAVYVNGYKMPAPYTLADLKVLIPKMQRFPGEKPVTGR